MNSLGDIPHLILPQDVLLSLREWIRRERQRANFTQLELARRSGIPATTISRLERTGFVSTDALLRILFALNLLDALQNFLKERLRLAAFPATLHQDLPQRVVKRVRHAK